MGRLLDRLAQKGWIRREADATDRRVKRIYLTEEVEPAIKAMRAAAAELRREAFIGFSAQERERMLDCLLAVKENLNNLDAAEAGNASRHRRRAA